MTTYLIKTVLCSGLLLLAYFLLLEKEKMHRFNRFYLLFSLLFSLLVPLVSIQTKLPRLPFSETVYTATEVQPAAAANVLPGPVVAKQKTPPVSIAWLCYVGVTGLLFLRFGYNLFLLLRKTAQSPSTPYGKAKLIFTNESEAPYSFLNCIFIGREEHGTPRKEILCHELTHVLQRHTVDVLLIELLLVVVWFNPFFYGYRKAIRLNHEYMADDAVVKNFDTRTYQDLLLNTLDKTAVARFTSSFNYFITKKRLTMMLKTTSPVAATVRGLSAAFLTAAVGFFFCTRVEAQQTLKPADTAPVKDTVARDTVKPSPWVGISIGSTKEGVSEELLNEYQDIIDRCFKAGDKRWILPAEDKARLEAIFKQMNPEQQNRQTVAFISSPKPLPKVVPTKEQFQKFKNASVYGVWIDDKKVSNETLNNHENTDFSQVFISKLYGGAKKGRSYTHQVNLMTKAYYEKYRNDALQNRRPLMVFRSPTKTSIRQE